MSGAGATAERDARPAVRPVHLSRRMRKGRVRAWSRGTMAWLVAAGVLLAGGSTWAEQAGTDGDGEAATRVEEHERGSPEGGSETGNPPAEVEPDAPGGGERAQERPSPSLDGSDDPEVVDDAAEREGEDVEQDASPEHAAEEDAGPEVRTLTRQPRLQLEGEEEQEVLKFPPHPEAARIRSDIDGALGPTPDYRRLVLEVPALKVGWEQFGSTSAREGYAGVRNDRVRQADNTTFGLRMDGRLTHETDPALTSLHVLAVFRRQSLRDADEPVVLEDLVRLEGSTDVRGYESRLLGPDTSLMPTVALRYTTAFTRTEVRAPDTGEVLGRTRRSVLRGSMGAVARLPGDVREVRGTVFVERDLAAIRGREVSGLAGSVLHERALERLGGEARWRNTLEVDWYVPSSGDGATDLRFTMDGRSAVSVPLVGGVRSGVFVSGYLFRGALPSQRRLELTTITGLELGFSGTRSWRY